MGIIDTIKGVFNMGSDFMNTTASTLGQDTGAIAFILVIVVIWLWFRR